MEEHVNELIPCIKNVSPTYLPACGLWVIFLDFISGWGVSPSQGFPHHKFTGIQLGGKWQGESKVFCNGSGLEHRLLDPESSVLTIRPQRIQKISIVAVSP